ncbi:MAG: hypothetical protein HY755_01060 [Nitrospirae bacterium]|nr:hypothetical protein [Nitrospirota bacterium]
MLNREELKEIAKWHSDKEYYVSLYLNVDPVTNPKGDYTIHFKNILRDTSEQMDKAVFKRVKKDLDKIESFIIGSKKNFKKGLAIISSLEKSFWKEYHLAVPVKNRLVVEKTPNIEPLLDILDNYQRYAVLLVDKESARLFLLHLGEIEEYGEIHTPGIPGRHKRGGWFSLSGHRFERHIDYHVSLHLKDVMKRLESFLSEEKIERIVIGGSEDAVSKVKAMIPKTLGEKIIGTFHTEMLANTNEILEKLKPVIEGFEMKKHKETIAELLTRAMKRENAVVGIENVLSAIQEGKVMRLLFVKDFSDSGYACRNCRYLSKQKISSCPYCKGDVEEVNYLVDLASQRAVESGAVIEVVAKNKDLSDAGGIGAFLRF